VAESVVIAAYNPDWPKHYARLARALREGLQGVAERIEHVGSTAIPGMPAKPILDVDVVVASRESVPEAIARLERMGYRHQGDLGIPGREAFQAPAGAPLHHLYVCSQDSGELARHLAFRDCLRTDAEMREAYAELKQRLQVRFRFDRVRYTENKTAFVHAALSRWWKATVELRPSTPDDAELAADWAEAKRHQYQSYAPVFWKPAVDAHIRHRPFLEACLRSPDFTSFSAANDHEALGLVLASHQVSAPLLPPGWLIDDFYVARPELWHSVGVRLLEAEADAARGSGCRHLMVVSGYRDAAKKEFLRHCGLQSEVVWWVKPIRPDHNTGRIGEVRMVVGPAPPVYDPGGLTALAIEEPREAGLFEDAAAQAGAVLAIMPVRSANRVMSQELRESGYAEASEWFMWTL
jgi:GrpB-like predicted nucleotidyltransferase (UPF0157 family)